MLSPRRMFEIVVLSMVVLSAAACDREITRIEQVTTAQNCFDCHSDNNTFLVAAEQQWLRSHHASGENIDRNRLPCNECHTSDGFVSKVTTGSGPGMVDNPTPIHCFTCHAPHSNGDFRLRVTTAPALENGVAFDIGAGNICVSCHHSRKNVDTYVRTANDTVSLSRFWGPHHGTQGDMLIGTNGYEYTGFTYGQTFHRTAVSPVTGAANGCLNCHKDVTSNLRVGGHSFNMSHAVGADTLVNTDVCGGCHGGMSDFNYANVRDSVDAYLTTLKGQLLAANLIDATDHPVSRVVASSDSAGAVWNFLMVHEDRSHGVHNRRYMEDLLRSAILFMQGALPSSQQFATNPGGSDSGQQ